MILVCSVFHFEYFHVIAINVVCSCNSLLHSIAQSARTFWFEESLQSAIEELRDMRSAVQLRDKLGIELQYETYSDLRKKLNSQALGDVRKVAETADTYIGEAPLDVIDEQVWRSMPNDEDAEGEKRRTVKVPFGPNGVLCVIFSCVNDPRMMPSTDLLLTKQMLDTGLRMGMSKDRRITNQGILSNIDDLESKLVAYAETLRARTSFNNPKRASETPAEIVTVN